MRLSQLPRRTALAVVVATVACTGVAVAATGAVGDVLDRGGTIHGCVAESGALKIVSPGEACHSNQAPLAWTHVRAFRMLRATPDEVEITAVGTGPIGFPTPDAPPTEVLALELPQGVYELSAAVEARKAFGNGDLLCWAEYAGRLPIFIRASLGTDPGHAMRATLGGGGFVSIPEGGGTVRLACWQASNDSPGSPSGERPTVFYAFLNATAVSRATLRRFNSDVVTELP
jgi:hypothetical protein